VTARLEKVVTGAIVANAGVFVWGLVDDTGASEMVEHCILALFVMEMAVKMYGQRWGYFTKPWQVFDAVVIGLSLAPLVPTLAVLRVARLARLAKVLHLARHAVQLRIVALARN
jgi:voltage-gated sodium channel